MSKKTEKKAVKSSVITMVVDESGSMTHLFDATVAGFNEYVGTLQKDMKGDKAYFSAITFDSTGIRKLQTGAPLSDAVSLNRENYKPNAYTPLLDAVGSAIKATDEVMAKEKADKAVIVIQTDGQENASKDHTLSQIKMMIEDRQAKGWQFVFIGAGIDAFGDAAKMGISVINTVSYRPDAAGTRHIFDAMASNTASYASGSTMDMHFTESQSLRAGESKQYFAAKMRAAAGQKAPKPKCETSPLDDLSLTK